MATSNSTKVGALSHRLSSAPTQRGIKTWASKIQEKISTILGEISSLKNGFLKRFINHAAIAKAQVKVHQLKEQLACWVRLTGEAKPC